MFPSLPHTFRKHQLNADVRSLLQLRKAMDKGLVNTLGDIYVVLKGLITNDPKDFGPFTKAFYDYFLAVDIQPEESLDTAVQRSEAFKNWKNALLEDEQFVETPDLQQLIDRFLDEVHLSSFDIQQTIDGKQILAADDPNQTDDNPQDNGSMPEKLDKMADYRDVSLEELIERMKKVAQQQRGAHFGGNHWIGQGGTSPYGNNGAAAGGVRVGGGGGGKMARAVINDARFYPVDTKARLQDDNIDATLAILKGIEDESAEILLDIPTTITEGLKQGGIFLPIVKEKITQKVQVVLIIDNGGFSMSPYIQSVRKLFSKMKTRFAHDLKTYYYHNTIYKGVYSDPQRRNFVSLKKITGLDKNYSIFIVGDADMAPYELHDQSIQDWQQLKKTFKRIAWLNPMQERFWVSSDTVPVLRRIINMYPLTPAGIEEAVTEMNRKRQYSKKG